MMKNKATMKNNYFIEVKVPSGCEGWQNVVNDKMSQALEKLKVVVEELGGKVYIRY
ncbi:MAG: hypothetical protein ACQXXH_02805 [Candidatus Bathyarchaeia archaeon]|jgi:hypothetical protein|nr:hypothetical protein [Candidatus Bathyarchaeota archaeon A05DMB-4]MDH7594673.1 hypothetical protein [Candidatus Bathyarchaeota archaeon]